MASLEILRAEGASFADAARDIVMFTPRHRTHGAFLGKHVGVGGRRTIDLSGLDYLALGSDPVVKRILAESLAEHDCGIPGSEAIIQTVQSAELEQALAHYHFGQGAAITFTAGYGTNFSIMEALGLRTHSHFVRMHCSTHLSPRTADAPTIFFLDGDLHFSARHGIRLARKIAPHTCFAHVFRTGDYEHLEQLLRRAADLHGRHAVRVILSDTVDSATGREFDVATLCAIAEAHDCVLYLDEAHAVGVIGPRGRGVAAKVEGFERYRERLVLMGTLTKVFCQPGGYVVLDDSRLAAMLKFCSPQHVFSAPIAPWIGNALVRILDLVAGPDGDARRARVRNCARLTGDALRAGGFDVIGAQDTPILATPLRNPRVGAQVLEFMQQEGFVISIFQGPLMPRGREVLRLAMRADLSEEEIQALASALARCRDALRFDRATE